MSYKTSMISPFVMIKLYDHQQKNVVSLPTIKKKNL